MMFPILCECSGTVDSCLMQCGYDTEDRGQRGHTEELAAAKDFAAFIAASPSSYHAAAEIARRLENAGFRPQLSDHQWDATPGGHFMVSGGAVMAWQVPEGASSRNAFAIVGAHTDSPGFRLKPSPESTAYGFGQVDVEPYGGLLLNSWLNREMGIAGRITTIDGEDHLVRTDPIMVIPQLAPHLDRSVREKLTLNPQKHMHPVWTLRAEEAGTASDGDADCLWTILAQSAGVDAGQIAGFDLFAYDAQAPQILNETFLAAGRQDNLSSVFPAVTAMTDPDFHCEEIAVFAAFDHEEVGSQTATGAQGPLLEMVLRRTALALGATEEEYFQMVARSSCISSDAGHSVNPNYAEFHDPTQYPVAGRGPMIKINANQRYASDSHGQALWLRAAYAAGESTQEFVSNNAVSCGTTIGPLTATRIGVETVDVGIPLLSMHSARELSAIHDTYALAKILMGYWSIV